MNNTKFSSNKNLHFILRIIVIPSILQSCVEIDRPEIAQWRGTERSGIFNEDNLLDNWAKNGPELLWVYNGIGKGFASPAILNNRIFVNGEIDSTSFLFAFNLDGKLLWKSSNGKEFMGEGFSRTYPGSRSTPTVVDNLVYTSSGKGRIACFDTETGEEKWAVNIISDFKGLESEFGYSESLLVDNNKVFCFPGGTKNNMVALNRFSGEIIWSSEAMKDTFSYCSPILVNLPEHEILITHSRHYLYAIDCKNGNALGSFKLKGYEWDGEHCNTPVFSDGDIYFIGNDEKGEGALKLNLSENGESIKKVWSNPKIRNNFNGYVKVDNYLFTTIKGNRLYALDTNNGTITDSVKVATGSLIFADNKFICYGMNGEVNLIKYAKNKFNITGSYKIRKGTGHHFSHPVIADRILYVRHGNALVAYNIGL